MRTRLVLGWLVIGIAVVTSLPILRDARSNYHNWHTTLNDPSGKDAYLTFLEVDIVVLVILILIGGAGWLILRSGHRAEKI